MPRGDPGKHHRQKSQRGSLRSWNLSTSIYSYTYVHLYILTSVSNTDNYSPLQKQLLVLVFFRVLVGTAHLAVDCRVAVWVECTFMNFIVWAMQPSDGKQQLQQSSRWRWYKNFVRETILGQVYTVWASCGSRTPSTSRNVALPFKLIPMAFWGISNDQLSERKQRNKQTTSTMASKAVFTTWKF